MVAKRSDNMDGSLHVATNMYISHGNTNESFEACENLPSPLQRTCTFASYYNKGTLDVRDTTSEGSKLEFLIQE